MMPMSEPLLVPPRLSRKVPVMVCVVSGMLVTSAYLLAIAGTRAGRQNSMELGANCCPADNGGCCWDCEHNQYCPKDQGCYSSGQSGCDVPLCPPPVEVRTRPTTSNSPKRLLRDCLFDECERSGCDRMANPFFCLSPVPAPYLGCSSDPWTEAACQNACSLAQCSKAKHSHHEPTCKIPCPAERCAQINAPVPQQRCGAAAPFQCLTGSAAMACTADEFHYALVSDVVCASCCDVTSCEVGGFL